VAAAGASNETLLPFMYDDAHAYTQAHAALLPPDTVLADYLIWDTGCDTNTYCDASLVTNVIGIAPRTIKGVGTGTATTAGECVFGDVIINPSQGVNLISQSYVRDAGIFRCAYNDNEDSYVVYNDTATVTFARLGGLYAVHKDDKQLHAATKAAANAFADVIQVDSNTGKVTTVLPLHARERAALASHVGAGLGLRVRAHAGATQW